ncbi:diadenylate cyclase CdaA [Parabacteroides sp. FAFU027]|uniref:diadenylate cyclase CdaA n=1 Tax=Parabacteroides sp. FAFU027 TaxID=2922715 RepID=UPI001FAEC57B|nr:diadenylate cyclase CdaA [Parabacteroides sp. FAFU027]
MLAYLTIKDIIDILLVAFLLYYTYRLMKASGTINVFIGVLTIIGIWLLVSHVLGMRLLGSIMDKLVSVGVIALVILFQDEIRRFLINLGSHKRWRYLLKFFISERNVDKDQTSVMPIVIACRNMANKKTGALIVIAGEMSLISYEKTGEPINGDVGTSLIENIFFKNSPLHDGAMIIVNDKIVAAGCILPVSHDTQLPKELGLRHRAALGITQETDAKVIVVSEERGTISLAHKNQLFSHINPEELESLLTRSEF